MISEKINENRKTCSQAKQTLIGFSFHPIHHSTLKEKYERGNLLLIKVELMTILQPSPKGFKLCPWTFHHTTGSHLI